MMRKKFEPGARFINRRPHALATTNHVPEPPRAAVCTKSDGQQAPSRLRALKTAPFFHPAAVCIRLLDSSMSDYPRPKYPAACLLCPALLIIQSINSIRYIKDTRSHA